MQQLLLYSSRDVGVLHRLADALTALLLYCNAISFNKKLKVNFKTIVSDAIHLDYNII